MTKQNLCAGWLGFAFSVLTVGGLTPNAQATDEPKPAPVTAMSMPDPADIGNGEPYPGQLSSKFRVDDHNPEASVPSAQLRDQNPLEYGYFLQDLLARAEDSRKQHDYKAVIAYYRAVAKAVPESAKGWSKLCEAYESVNDRDRAILACRAALDRNGVEMGDYIRYVHLILGRDGPLSTVDRQDLDAVLEHLDKQPSLEIAASHLRCEVGVKAHDITLLERCTSVLARLAPSDPKTIVFQWSLALQKGQRSEAAQLLERAKKAGIVLDNVERMEKITGSYRRMWPPLVGAVLLFASAMMVWVLLRRRATNRLAG